MSYLRLLPFAAGLLLMTCARLESAQLQVSANYPFVHYLKITEVQRKHLTRKFIKKNGAKWKIKFDDFGFVESVRITPYGPRERGFQFTDQEKDEIRHLIDRNRELFGIEGAFPSEQAPGPAVLEFHSDPQGDRPRFSCFRDIESSARCGGQGVPTIHAGISLWNEEASPHEHRSLEISGHFWPKAVMPKNVPSFVKVTAPLASRIPPRDSNPPAPFFWVSPTGDLRILYEVPYNYCQRRGRLIVDAYTGETLSPDSETILLKKHQESWAACLPLGCVPEDKALQTSIGQALNDIHARCNSSGKLVSLSAREVLFYKVTGCWGNAPIGYQQILEDEKKHIKELNEKYAVIELTCNPSGVPIP